MKSEDDTYNMLRREPFHKVFNHCMLKYHTSYVDWIPYLRGTGWTIKDLFNKAIENDSLALAFNGDQLTYHKAMAHIATITEELLDEGYTWEYRE